MKQVLVPRTRLAGQRDFHGALNAVFGPAMLRRMHGPAVRVGAFDDRGHRTFKFVVPVDQVPAPIRTFFCGSQLGVTTRQALRKGVRAWTVTNSLKLHFVGSELFKIRPTFWLERDPADGTIALSGCVRHDAVLPPPLCHIAEGFMALNSQRELLHFARCLHEAGLLEAVPEAVPEAPPPPPRAP